MAETLLKTTQVKVTNLCPFVSAGGVHKDCACIGFLHVSHDNVFPSRPWPSHWSFSIRALLKNLFHQGAFSPQYMSKPLKSFPFHHLHDVWFGKALVQLLFRPSFPSAFCSIKNRSKNLSQNLLFKGTQPFLYGQRRRPGFASIYQYWSDEG